MKQPRPLKALAGLTEDQVNLLAHWVEVHSYRQAVELAHEKFGRTIPKSTLQRLMARRRTTEFLDDSPDALEAARQINRFAATAETHFSTATIHLLERQAFELALTRNDKENHQALKDILFLLQRHRSNDIHERRVRVQEEKLAMKKAEIAAESDTEGDDFSKVIDKILKNHPAFLASARAADSDPNPNPNYNLNPNLRRRAQRKPVPEPPSPQPSSETLSAP